MWYGAACRDYCCVRCILEPLFFLTPWSHHFVQVFETVDGNQALALIFLTVLNFSYMETHTFQLEWKVIIGSCFFAWNLHTSQLVALQVKVSFYNIIYSIYKFCRCSGLLSTTLPIVCPVTRKMIANWVHHLIYVL